MHFLFALIALFVFTLLALFVQLSSQSGSRGQNAHLIQRILEQIEQKPLSVASRHTRVRQGPVRLPVFTCLCVTPSVFCFSSHLSSISLSSVCLYLFGLCICHLFCWSFVCPLSVSCLLNVCYMSIKCLSYSCHISVILNCLSLVCLMSIT